jgi:hypothetical protein
VPFFRHISLDTFRIEYLSILKYILIYSLGSQGARMLSPNHSCRVMSIFLNREGHRGTIAGRKHELEIPSINA